jgi:hypothetical protein
MTDDCYYINASWLSVQTSHKALVPLISRLFKDLESLNPQLATWYQKAYSKKKALQHRIEFSENELCNKSNLRETIYFPEFILSGWSGHQSSLEAFSFSLRLNEYFNPTVTTNHFLLTIPLQGEIKQKLLAQDMMCKLFMVIKNTLNPDRITLRSYDLSDKISTNKDFGWMFYHKLGLITESDSLRPFRIKHLNPESCIIGVPYPISGLVQDSKDIMDLWSVFKPLCEANLVERDSNSNK